MALKKAAGQKCEGNKKGKEPKECQKQKDEKQRGKEDRYTQILPSEIGICSPPYSQGYFFHLVVSLGKLQYPPCHNKGKNQSTQSAYGRQQRQHKNPLLLSKYGFGKNFSSENSKSKLYWYYI